MSGATLGTKVRTEQLSKHGSGYQFQPGCWPHLSVNTGAQVQTDPPVSPCQTTGNTSAVSRRIVTVSVSCDLMGVSLQFSAPKHEFGQVGQQYEEASTLSLCGGVPGPSTWLLLLSHVTC